MRTRIFTIVALILLFCTCRVQAAVNWDVYSDAMIQEGDIYNVVSIYDTPPDQTTVTMVGGLVDVMRPYDASTLNVTQGDIYTVGAMASSTVNISGQAQIRTLGVNEWSTVNISGGNVLGATATGYATLNISGGSVGGSVRVGDFSMMNMTGGEMSLLNVSEKAVVNLSGGIISEGIGSRSFEPDVTINFYGYDLVKTSSGGKYGYGQVYGFYMDGSEFSVDLGEISQTSINLIPEPSTILLLGLGGLVVRTRKRRV
jgi:hypothetical protein